MGMAAKNNVTTYSATSKLYIVNKDSFGIKMADLQLGTALTSDYQEVFKTWEVHEMVIEELNLPYSYQEMQSMLTVSNPEDTRVLYITVTYSALPYLTTDLTDREILSLAYRLLPLASSISISSHTVPASDCYYSANIRGMSVLVPDLPLIRQRLEEYLPLE